MKTRNKKQRGGFFVWNSTRKINKLQNDIEELQNEIEDYKDDIEAYKYAMKIHNEIIKYLDGQLVDCLSNNNQDNKNRIRELEKLSDMAKSALNNM